MCSPTRYTKIFKDRVYSALMLARHVSDLTGPSSGAFLKAVFADFGMCCNTRTTRHVQPLRSCRNNFVYLVGLHIYYKMIHGPCNVKLTFIL